MNLRNNFLIKVTLFIGFIFTGILLLNQISIISFDFLKSFIIAGVITYLNFVFGYLFLKFSHNKSDNIFLILILGGMLLRLFMILLLVFISLKFLDIKTGVFIFIVRSEEHTSELQ